MSNGTITWAFLHTSHIGPYFFDKLRIDTIWSSSWGFLHRRLNLGDVSRVNLHIARRVHRIVAILTSAVIRLIQAA